MNTTKEERAELRSALTFKGAEMTITGNNLLIRLLDDVEALDEVANAAKTLVDAKKPINGGGIGYGILAHPFPTNFSVEFRKLQEKLAFAGKLS